ncbi:MAG: Abi family protein, partial [Culicoidibacterales bacterium]
SLMRAESFLASIISHVFCELHGGGYSYLNTTNFSSDKNHTLEIARLISTCATVINRNKKLNQIQHYQKNHGDVPLWVAISHFEFGLLSRFFELMNEKARAKITRIINEHLASEHNIQVRLTPKQIDAYIYNLRMIRNVCAHDNRMLSIELANLPAQKDLMDIDGQLNTLFPHLLMMKCFLNASQYNILIASLKKRTKNLDKKLQKYSTGISANDIASSLGFPPDWHKS